MQRRWSYCDQYPSGILLVVELDLPDIEILFSRVCTIGVLYTHSPCFGFQDVCWPIVLWTHGIGLTLEFSHCISPIKESIVNRLGIILEERL